MPHFDRVPDKSAWHGHQNDFDVRNLHERFFGQSHEQVQEYFGEGSSISRVDELTFASRPVFQYYVQSFDALRIANGTKYALTGGVFSRSPENIAKVKRKFRVGNLYVNRKCTGALVHRQPFGGFKLSGIGSKAGGPDYLLQFVVPRTITENTLRRGFAPESGAVGE